MKEWKCVKLQFYLKIPQVIKEHQKEGWTLHTYTTSSSEVIQHFLLFEREQQPKN
jgi:hypothetical protein